MNKRQLISWPLFAFALIFAFTNARLTMSWLNNSSDPGWLDAHSNNQIIAMRVRSELSNALKPGDQILLINGKQLEESFSIYRYFEHSPPGTPYTLRINRAGNVEDLRLTTQPFTRLWTIGLIVTVVIVPTIFWLAGFILFVLSLGEKRLILIAVALALTIPEVPLFSLQSVPMWTKLVMFFGRPLSFLVFPLYLNFVLTYPEPSPLLEKWPRLNRGIRLYLPYIAIGFCLAMVITIVSSISPREAFALRNSWPGYLVRYGVALIYIPAIFVAIALSLKARTVVTQRRVTILAVGIICGLAAFLVRAAFLFTLWFLPLEWQASVPARVMELMVLVAFTALALMPFIVTYAIVRRRLIPLNIATRRALHYVALYAFLSAPFLLGFLILDVFLLKMLTAAMTDMDVASPLFLLIVILLLEIFTFVSIHQRFIRPTLKRRAAQPGYDLTNAFPDLGYQIMTLAKAAWSRIWGRETYRDVIDRVRSELVNSTGIEDIAHRVCKIIQETWITDNAIIFLDDRNSGNYVCAAASKFLTGYNLTRQAMAELVLPNEGHIVNELSVRRRRMLESEDLKDDKKPADWGFTFSERQVLTKLEPALMLPIFIDEQMIGILSVGQPAAEFRYSVKLKQTLVDIAAQAAAAIDLVRLKSIAGSPDLSGLLINVIKSAMTSVPAQKGSIYLWSEGRQTLRMRAQVGLFDHFVNRIELQSGEGFAGLCFETGESLIVDLAQSDERRKDMGVDQLKDIQSSICVPLITWSRVIGVLCLDNVVQPNAFTQTHVNRVAGIASYAAVIVQNTRLQTELSDLALYLSPANLHREVINAEAVDSRKDSVSLILSRTFQSIRRITEVKTANLVLLMDPYMPDKCIQQPLAVISEGFEDNEGFSRSLRLKPKGYGQHALETRNAVTGVGLRSFPESTTHEEGTKSKSFICLPLDISKYIGGLLYLHYDDGLHEFTDTEKSFLSLCSDHVALAIANVRRYEELLYTNKVVWMSLMMSNTVHEMRQSTEAIRQVMDVVNMGASDDELSELMGQIKANLDDIRKLQERSLPSASDNVKEVVELSPVLRLEPQQWCKKEDLDCTGLEPEQCYVYIDRRQLSLVIKNLTMNAVKAMKSANPKRLTVTSKRVGKRIEVRMSNNGKPILPEMQEALFTDLISTTNKGRPGIGLFIGRRILRFHEGELNFVASNDEATIFSFWLPTVVAKTPELALEAFQHGNF